MTDVQIFRVVEGFNDLFQRGVHEVIQTGRGDIVGIGKRRIFGPVEVLVGVFPEQPFAVAERLEQWRGVHIVVVGDGDEFADLLLGNGAGAVKRGGGVPLGVLALHDDLVHFERSEDVLDQVFVEDGGIVVDQEHGAAVGEVRPVDDGGAGETAGLGIVEIAQSLNGVEGAARRGGGNIYAFRSDRKEITLRIVVDRLGGINGDVQRNFVHRNAGLFAEDAVDGAGKPVGFGGVKAGQNDLFFTGRNINFAGAGNLLYRRKHRADGGGKRGHQIVFDNGFGFCAGGVADHGGLDVAVRFKGNFYATFDRDVFFNHELFGTEPEAVAVFKLIEAAVAEIKRRPLQHGHCKPAVVGVERHFAGVFKVVVNRGFVVIFGNFPGNGGAVGEFCGEIGAGKQADRHHHRGIFNSGGQIGNQFALHFDQKSGFVGGCPVDRKFEHVVFTVLNHGGGAAVGGVLIGHRGVDGVVAQLPVRAGGDYLAQA